MKSYTLPEFTLEYSFNPRIALKTPVSMNIYVCDYYSDMSKSEYRMKNRLFLKAIRNKILHDENFYSINIESVYNNALNRREHISNNKIEFVNRDLKEQYIWRISIGKIESEEKINEFLEDMLERVDSKFLYCSSESIYDIYENLKLTYPSDFSSAADSLFIEKQEGNLLLKAEGSRIYNFIGFIFIEPIHSIK